MKIIIKLTRIVGRHMTNIFKLIYLVMGRRLRSIIIYLTKIGNITVNLNFDDIVDEFSKQKYL